MRRQLLCFNRKRTGRRRAAGPWFLTDYRDRWSRLLVAAVHSEGHCQLFEPLGEAVAGGVDVLGFGDELQLVLAADAEAVKDRLIRRERFAIDDEQLVLVELNFLG